MPKEFYIRTFSAGRYRKVIRYPRSLPGDNAAARQAKHQLSAAAQRYINIRDATENLQWLLCCNYDRKSAAFLTMTFDDDHLPDSRDGVRNYVRKFVRQARPYFEDRPEGFPVIYTIEGQPEPRLPQANSAWEVSPWKDTPKWNALDPKSEDELRENTVRLHAHMFLLLPEKSDKELVKSLWSYGVAYINYIKVNDFQSFVRLAAYVTKESRLGTRPANERAYVPSLNLIKPSKDGHWAREFEAIGYPSGAEELGDGHDRDAVTGMETNWIMYRFPRSPQQPTPYKSKGRISSRGKPAKSKQTATRSSF